MPPSGRRSRPGSMACGKRRTPCLRSCTGITPLPPDNDTLAGSAPKKTGRQGVPFFIQPASCLQRPQVDFHATVLRLAGSGVVAGDRLARANATAADTRTGYALASEVGSNAGGAFLGQAHVQLQGAGAIGMANNVDPVLVELLEHLDQRVQRREEAAGDIRRAAGEGDVARHDQLQVIAVAHHLHAGAAQLLTQTLLLTVSVVAVTRTRGAPYHGTDQRALTPVLLARGSRPDQRTRCSATAAVDARLAGFTLTGIGIVGTTCQQRNTGRGGNKCFD